MISDKQRKLLIEEALAAGYRVTMLKHDIVRISTNICQDAPGVIIWANGVATRTDVPCDQATAIRTAKAVRQLLSLPQ